MCCSCAGGCGLLLTLNYIRNRRHHNAKKKSRSRPIGRRNANADGAAHVHVSFSTTCRRLRRWSRGPAPLRTATTQHHVARTVASPDPVATPSPSSSVMSFVVVVHRAYFHSQHLPLPLLLSVINHYKNVCRLWTSASAFVDVSSPHAGYCPRYCRRQRIASVTCVSLCSNQK